LSRVAAIVLAAGRGTRFGGGSKLLAPFDGAPLVRHAARAALASRATPVIVVTGHEADAVGLALGDLPVATVRNPDYGQGLSTSLRAGFAALPDDAAGAVVLLGDMPLVGPDIVDRLIAAFAGQPPPLAVAPVSGGRRGNPVLLSRALAGRIGALAGDVGAGPLLRGLPDVVEIPVEGEAALADVDTPEALAALRLKA